MRRIGLAVVALNLILISLSVEAQQAQRVYRIGFLGQTSPSDYSSQIAALRQGLRDAGYQEGATLSIEYRWAEGRLGRLPSLATDLVRSKVDLIVIDGTAGARAAKQATATIPIVLRDSGRGVGRDDYEPLTPRQQHDGCFHPGDRRDGEAIGIA